MRVWVRPLLLFVALGTAGGCFRVDEPICSYRCGAGIDCPESYECRSDGYCHLEGSTESCSYSDASVVVDMSIAPDLVSVDGDTPD